MTIGRTGYIIQATEYPTRLRYEHVVGRLVMARSAWEIFLSFYVIEFIKNDKHVNKLTTILEKHTRILSVNK